MKEPLAKPMPHPTPVSRPFWDGLMAGRVMIQRCGDCDAWVFYPRSRCHHCLSDRLDWRQVSGAGTLYTFTIARQPTAPFFADEVPQRLAVVELDEGVRLTSTLVDVADEDVRVGMRLRPVFDRVADEVTLLRFAPADPR
ncbi:MAG: Zn-ribbon domain-containing OB-fold protein [Pseudomonadales bacterium]